MNKDTKQTPKNLGVLFLMTKFNNKYMFCSDCVSMYLCHNQFFTQPNHVSDHTLPGEFFQPSKNRLIQILNSGYS